MKVLRAYQNYKLDKDFEEMKSLIENYDKEFEPVDLKASDKKKKKEEFLDIIQE